MNRFPLVQGFTLPELLVAIVMLSILILIAAPPLQDVLTRNRIQAEQRDLKVDVAYARSEAILQNTFVSICGTSNGASCNDSNDWSAGWLIFSDNGDGSGGVARDGIRNGSEKILRVYSNQNDNSLVVEDAKGTGVKGFGFDQRGYLSIVSEKLSLKLCDVAARDEHARGLSVSFTGRVSDAFDMSGNRIYEDVNGSDFSC